MSKYILWPHRLVFNFAYGRWCTFLFLFTATFSLFYFLRPLSAEPDRLIPLFFCFIIAYLIPASHYISHQTIDAYDSLSPYLNLDSSEIVEVRDSLALWTLRPQMKSLAIGVAGGCMHSYFLLATEGDLRYLAMLPGFFATFIPMAFIFLIPLFPIRKRIREYKFQELEQIQQHLNKLTSGKSNLEEDEEKVSALQPLFEYRREIRQVSEWPFDSPVFMRLLFYLTIPPLTWVGAALIERLVDLVSL